MNRKRKLWRTLLCVVASAILLTSAPMTAVVARADTQGQIDALKE